MHDSSPPVSLSKEAAGQIRAALEENQIPTMCLRVAVDLSDPEGPIWGMDFSERHDTDPVHDLLFESAGVTVVIAREQAELPSGTSISWTTEDGEKGFRFDNPRIPTRQ